MQFPLHARVWLSLALVAGTGVASAEKGTKATQPPTPTPLEQEIRPPFSLIWHEPSERVEGKVEAAKLSISDRRKIENRWVVTAVGFKKPSPGDPNAPKPPELRRVLFHFIAGSVSKEKHADGKTRDILSGGQLVEVELQYEQDGWDEEKYGECLGDKRRTLERLYGQGQQLVRDSKPTPDGNATQTIVGYKWNRNNTAVELIYFNVNANGGDQKFHTLSLHYKRS